jgi:formamidopyrimidine-DNA glycosylase
LPELPEVEVTRRKLEPLLLGRTIAQVRTTRDSYFFLTRPRALRRGLAGRRIEALSRLGKYLLARLDDEATLLLHLGMTGQLFGAGVSSVRLFAATRGAALAPEAQERGFRPDRHTHLRLRFVDGGPDVFFRDVRKFGKVQLLAPSERPRRLERLGQDALRINGRRLFAATRGRRVAIKALLLDQAVLAGVGNIYADEALHRAGVRPTRPSRRLDPSECERVAAGLRRVLRRSIATGGSSISDYVQPDGEDGAFQEERRVYGRTGEACLACSARIRRIVIGQRAAHYCPRCQR